MKTIKISDLNSEVWKPVIGFEKTHAVSSFGRVKTLARVTSHNHQVEERTLPWNLSGPYPRVCLKANNVSKIARVHKVVTAAFFGPCPKGCVVRHIDGDPMNNTVDNLSYGTHLQNARDQTRHGTQALGERHGVSKLSNAQVLDIKKRIAGGDSHTEISKDYGVCRSNISQIAEGRTWGWLHA